MMANPTALASADASLDGRASSADRPREQQRDKQYSMAWAATQLQRGRGTRTQETAALIQTAV